MILFAFVCYPTMRQYKEAVNVFRVVREYLISVIRFGGK